MILTFPPPMMTTTQSKSAQPIQYPVRTVKRASQAMRCLPFQLPLFMAMRSSSVSLQAIAGQEGVNRHYINRPLSELAVEGNLMWLIQVGILRREVDGQGITDSFRLTPLGHQLVEKWVNQSNILPPPSLWERCNNALNRRLRLPL